MVAAFFLASLFSAGFDLRQPQLLFEAAAECRPAAAQKSLQLAQRRRAPKKNPPKGKEPPASSSAEAASPSADTPAGGPLGRSTRIEFEGQLIKGQTTKAGEVQILERKDSEMKSMVKRRTSYREEIIKSVFPTVP